MMLYVWSLCSYPGCQYLFGHMHASSTYGGLLLMMPGVTSDLAFQLQTQRLSICACAFTCHRIQIPTAVLKPFISNADSVKFSTAATQRHLCCGSRTEKLLVRHGLTSNK